MKRAKIKEKKEEKKKEVVQDNFASPKNILITLSSIIIVFVGFYFLTDYLVNSKKEKEVEVVDPVEEKYILFSQILKQEDKEYYVLATLPSDTNKKNVESLVSGLNNNVYKIDMTDSLNKSHIGEETKIGEEVKDIIISDTTLFVIKEGKIVDAHTGYKDIMSYVKDANK